MTVIGRRPNAIVNGNRMRGRATNLARCTSQNCGLVCGERSIAAVSGAGGIGADGPEMIRSVRNQT